MYFDTHAHYDDERFDADRDEMLASLPAKGVRLVVNPGCGLESSRLALSYAERFGHMYAAVGAHPHEAAEVTPEWLDFFAASHEKRVAIGEIGLDYHYDFSPREIQRSVFKAQMEIARALNLPVIVHDREAHEDCLNIVRQFPGVRGVYHCYSGSLEQAKILVSLGWSISFTGSVTFKNAKKAAETAAWLPADRLMIETDSPYMTPEPHRGKRCDSTYLPYVAQKLGELRGVSSDEIEELTWNNGRAFFGININSKESDR